VPGPVQFQSFFDFVALIARIVDRTDNGKDELFTRSVLVNDRLRVIVDYNFNFVLIGLAGIGSFLS